MIRLLYRLFRRKRRTKPAETITTFPSSDRRRALERAADAARRVE